MSLQNCMHGPGCTMTNCSVRLRLCTAHPYLVHSCSTLRLTHVPTANRCTSLSPEGCISMQSCSLLSVHVLQALRAHQLQPWMLSAAMMLHEHSCCPAGRHALDPCDDSFGQCGARVGHPGEGSAGEASRSCCSWVTDACTCFAGHSTQHVHGSKAGPAAEGCQCFKRCMVLLTCWRPWYIPSSAHDITRTTCVLIAPAAPACRGMRAPCPSRTAPCVWCASA